MADYKIYKLDDKTLAGIKAGDIEAINRFYFDNLVTFTKNAGRFISRRISNNFDRNDLLQQLYIDIPLFDFSSDTDIYFSVKKTFIYNKFGGIAGANAYNRDAFNRVSVSLDKPIDETDEDSAPIIDFLVSTPGADDNLILSEKRAASDEKTLKTLKKIFKGKDFKIAYEMIFNGRSYNSIKKAVTL